jgi:hypothetical protein
MQSGRWATYAAAVTLILSCAAAAAAQDPVASPAPDPVVTFSRIHDAEPAKFFDAATSAPDPTNANRLIIGFNSGFDPTTWLANDFRASALPFSRRAAMDTINFTIDAPSGFYISKITYSQEGIGSVARGSMSFGGATWSVSGVPATLGAFTNNPTLSATADLTALNLTSVPVSITESLFASTGGLAVTSAAVLVELLPLLLP